MAHDLDRAIADYAQRQRDKDAGLSTEERTRIENERAQKAADQRDADEAAATATTIQTVIDTINAEYAGRIPKLKQIGTGGGGPAGSNLLTTRSVSYALVTEDGNYTGSTMQFVIEPRRGIAATMSPVGTNLTSYMPVTLGDSAAPDDFWIKQMVAAYLDRKAE